MDFDLLAEGSNLVYQYTYTDTVEGNIGDTLSNSLSSYESTYTNSVKYIESITDVDDPHIVLRYKNLDDSLIYEVEFDENGTVNETIGEGYGDGDDNSTEPTTSSTNAKYDSIQDFIDSDEGQKIVEQTQESLKDTAIFELLAESDNKLIYQYKYTDTQKIDSEYFSDLMSGYESVYSDTAKLLKNQLDIDNPIVIIRYLNDDGSNIYTAEFDENGLIDETL